MWWNKHKPGNDEFGESLRKYLSERNDIDLNYPCDNWCLWILPFPLSFIMVVVFCWLHSHNGHSCKHGFSLPKNCDNVYKIENLLF